MIYKFNGECWYLDRRSPWLRMRQWLFWIGGWELANGAGWRPLLSNPNRLLGWMFMPPTPISVLGHRATFYGWGLTFRYAGSWLTVTFPRGDQPLRAYVSNDGTPQGAHTWIAGAPRDIVEMAERARRQHEACA